MNLQLDHKLCKQRSNSSKTRLGNKSKKSSVCTMLGEQNLQIPSRQVTKEKPETPPHNNPQKEEKSELQWDLQRNKRTWLTLRKKKWLSRETISEHPKILELAGKDFKVAIINILKELKKIMFKIIKGKYDDNDSGHRKSQWRDLSNYKTGPNGNCEVEKCNWNEKFNKGL